MPRDCAAAFVCSRTKAMLGFKGFDKAATPCQSGNNLGQELEPLAAQLRALETRARYVPAGPAEAADQASSNRIGARRHDDWDDLRNSFCRLDCRRALRHDHIQPQSSQLGSDRRRGSRFGAEPNAALCIGVEGETGAFKCLTPSTLSPARPGLFFDAPMSASAIHISHQAHHRTRLGEVGAAA